ncbi:hypothetical protein POTOM_011090 [Populus tomentosa]|uniref:SAM domain-containing protein n=1 Tax=Populus tomentosa TaxID=118781 RepID=A0A8X8DB87_POPTO|nr:hypothetical protein POTOM_011090 [Populus tomentosa]
MKFWRVGDKANPSINFKLKEKKGGSHKKSILGWLYYTTDSSVDGFLQSLGLEKYLITFQAEEVDMTALVHMNDEDLKALGIPMVNSSLISWAGYA